MRIERIGDATLYCGDCREVLPTLGRVDAVVTDPPYGVGFAGSSTKHSKRSGVTYGSFDDTPEMVATVCVPAVRAAVALARSAAVTPGLKCADLYDRPVQQGVIFYPSGANAGPWGFICSQPIFYYGRDPYLMRGMGSRANGFSSTERADENGHPCPKPIKQTEWLINRVSFEGELVLDPFMGSGTTGVACVNLGRSFIGVEMYEPYFDIACRRVEAAQSQQRLFTEPKVKPEQSALFAGAAA